jgi:hypothetical protein
VIVRNLHEDTGEDTSLQSSSGEQAARDGAFEGGATHAGANHGLVTVRRFLLAHRPAAKSCAVLPAAEDKASICRELEISHFIDDRVHVMQILRGVVPHLCRFRESGAERFCPPWAPFATNWPKVLGWVSPSSSRADWIRSCRRELQRSSCLLIVSLDFQWIFWRSVLQTLHRLRRFRCKPSATDLIRYMWGQQFFPFLVGGFCLSPVGENLQADILFKNCRYT